MSVTPVFAGRVTDEGQIHLDTPEDFARHRRRFAGKRIELVLRVPRAQRSHRQNRYYWGVVVALLAEHCGYTPEEMHEALKWEFLRREEPGKRLPTVGSTAEMSTAAFEEYLESVRQWASTELRVYIPLPNEVAA